MLEGSKVGPEIHLLIFQAEFASNLVSVRPDCVHGKMQQPGYLLVSFAIFNQTGNLDFCGGKIQKP